METKGKIEKGIEYLIKDINYWKSTYLDTKKLIKLLNYGLNT